MSVFNIVVNSGKIGVTHSFPWLRCFIMEWFLLVIFQLLSGLFPFQEDDEMVLFPWSYVMHLINPSWVTQLQREIYCTLFPFCRWYGRNIPATHMLKCLWTIRWRRYLSLTAEQKKKTKKKLFCCSFFLTSLFPRGCFPHRKFKNGRFSIMKSGKHRGKKDLLVNRNIADIRTGSVVFVKDIVAEGRMNLKYAEILAQNQTNALKIIHWRLTMQSDSDL